MLKDYGVIERQDGTDVFVDFNAIVSDGYRNLFAFEQVKFSVEDGQKGLQAVNVVRL